MPVRFRVSLRIAGRFFAWIAAISAITLTTVAPAQARSAPWYLPWSGVVYHELRISDDQVWQTFWAVEATISVPCLPDNAPDGVYHAWIGLGGVKSGRIMRAGISAEMKRDGGTPIKTYRLWAENRAVRWSLNPVGASLPPSPTYVAPPSQSGEQLCGSGGIPIRVQADAKFFLNGAEESVGRPAAHNRLPTAEFIIQAASGAGRVTFGDAFMEARKTEGRLAIGWPRRSFGGTQCTPNGCEALVRQGVRLIGPTEARPSTFSVVIT